MIHHWLEAIGDENPIYVDQAAAEAAGHPGIVAPPAMIQVWTMMGLGGVRPDDDPLGKIIELFDDAGYRRWSRPTASRPITGICGPGEEVSVAAELTDVVGPEADRARRGLLHQPADHLDRCGDEDVAEMMWRIMKFKPARPYEAPVGGARDLDADAMMRPASSQRHQVLLGRRQRPRVADPEACPTAPCSIRRCRAVAGQSGADRLRRRAGRGTVFSFVVHHAPKVPGRTLPFVIALVELDEGVRMLGELRDVDPATWRSECPSAQRISTFPGNDTDRHGRCTHGSLTHERDQRVEVGTKLPELSLYGDPTFIVSTAIATRDYQDVHHDRDKAQAKGSKDIFVNILTDTGLVERFVTDWAGPTAMVKSIKLRLGVPWYAYDTVTFKGEVTAVRTG